MDGVIIRLLETAGEADQCARLMTASEPWVTLGRTHEASLRMLMDTSRERYVAVRGPEIAGFIILNMNGPLAGYIQIVCVAPSFRGTGTGTALMEFAEQRIFRDGPNVFLFVSSFNERARHFYESLGYLAVGEVTDYFVEGASEILMRKTLGPIGSWVNREEGRGKGARG